MMEPSDDEITRIALNQYANWIETGEPLLSRNDAEEQKRTRIINQLDPTQTKLVNRIRKLETKYQ
jgi:hypothetical protein